MGEKFSIGRKKPKTNIQKYTKKPKDLDSDLSIRDSSRGFPAELGNIPRMKINEKKMAPPMVIMPLKAINL